MKNALRLIVTLIIIALAATLISCEKSDYDERHYEQIIIDPEIPSSYSYSSSIRAEYGWFEVINIPIEDGGDYYFSTNAENTEIETAIPPTEVRYYPRPDDKNFIMLFILGTKVSYDKVNKDGTFKFYYQ